MKNCELCKHYEHRISGYPCRYCHFKNNKPHWVPTDEIAELIEAVERKAFDAAKEKEMIGKIFPAQEATYNETYQYVEVEKYESFEQWKEESK